MGTTSSAADNASTADLPEGLRRGDPDYRRAVLAMLAAGLASFNALYCTQAMLPTLTTELGVTPTQSALTVSATTGALALAIVPASILSERFGRGRVLVASVIAAVALGALLPLAPGIWWLIAGRGLQGALLAGVPAVAMTWLAEELHPDHLSRAMGVYVAGTSLGGLIGRIVPAGVLEFASWRWALGADALVATVFVVVILRMLPAQRRFTRKELHVRSEFTAMVGHWRDPRLAALFITAFLVMGVFVSFYNYLGFRMIDRFGLSEGLVGALFILYLSGTWSSARAGAWASRFGPGRVLVVMILTALAGIALTVSGNLAVTVLGTLLFTAAFFAVHSTASGWIGRLATSDRAEASSMYLFCYYLGSSLVGWFSGLILVRHSWTGLIVWLLAVLGVQLLIAVALTRDRIRRHAARGRV
ncbi:MFS transporter [Corynebacterium pygosceleis]|uniref:MFS transporter n=1 Tax=Corynebacterium pygosceleis TaxID=2800406 RepID=A0ABT3X0I2_9CORY|nr:MFS transporter [Corynebacterium pygosceleis]MCK7676267.1 MFS transporter [Corynebacterium pygosceleis]MCX7445771.1 MFS transporter [Corynebacterium pygosceleis]